MSSQKSPSAETQEKVGLKRKLTGPPRLLLSKSKSKGPHKEKEYSTNNTTGCNGTQRGSMSEHRLAIREESLRAASEDPERSTEECGETTPRDPAGLSGGPVISEGKMGEEHTNSKQNVKKHVKPRGWKNCCYPSLICLRRKPGKLEKVLAKEGDQCAGISFCETQSRSYVDSGEDNVKGDAVSLVGTKSEVTVCTNTSGTKGDRFTAGKWGTFKRLLGTTKYAPETKGGLPRQAPPFEPEKSPHSHFSFRNKLGTLLKNRNKKPSPFFQERFVESHEYIEEENIVLSNKCADDLMPDTAHVIQEGGYLEGGEMCRGPCSEMLTVSVEVTAIALGGKESRNLPELSMSSLEPEDHTPTQGQKQGGGKSAEYAEERLDSINGMLRVVDASEIGDAAILVPNDVLLEEKKETLVLKKDLISNVPGKTDRDFKEALLQETGPVTDKCRDLVAESHDSEEYDSVTEVNSPPNSTAGESSVQDDLPLKNVEFDCAVCCEEINGAVKNISDASPIENLQSGDSGYQSELSAEKLGPQCNEMLLRQTAYSLVQAAIKAALDQLEGELKNSTVSTHRELQELQGQA
ncbi:uncharacterized protein LOC108919389 [Scleropages formosus]|uniref:uncharacterized protein LOC108919389 n=1 Tax=Scleropages formosus TaxID=113540 RepID=UPI0010FA97EB|nr:uncharacterized protein LOC108919389 [Scleropages formosus]